MEFGTAQPRQFRVATRGRLAVDVVRQQPVSPQLLGIAQIFRLLAGQVLYPRDAFVRHAPWLAGARQVSQRCFQAKAQILTNAENHGVSIHLLGRGIRMIGEPTGGIQQYGCPNRAPLLFGPRPAD